MYASPSKLDRALQGDPLHADGHWHKLDFGCFASPCEVQYFCEDEQIAALIGSELVADARRIEAKFSRFRADSVIGRINAAAGCAAVAIDRETEALLKVAAELHTISNGLFDPTCGALRRIWHRGRTSWPNATELSKVLELVGWERFKWGDGNAYLPHRGMQIDLGGLGKEYAVDRACRLIETHGVRRGLINYGGDIRLIGVAQHGQPWNIGIRDPLRSERALAALGLRDTAVCTSGTQERCFEIGARRCSHLINPKSGEPVASFTSVTVVSPLCVLAGAISTATCLMDKGEGIDFLDSMQVSAVAIAADGERILLRC